MLETGLFRDGSGSSFEGVEIPAGVGDRLQAASLLLQAAREPPPAPKTLATSIRRLLGQDRPLPPLVGEGVPDHPPEDPGPAPSAHPGPPSDAGC